MTAAKTAKLGMSFATARARLDRDIMFSMAVKLGHKCFRCGGDLDRETLSVEHKQTWMSAQDPKGAFFDLDNVAFSHLHCNRLEAAERQRQYPDGRAAARAAFKRRYARIEDKPAERRARYLRTGY